MSPVIAYDVSRLFTGAIFATPRGIDRVDLALARHIFAEPSAAHVGVMPTLAGVRAFRASDVRRLLHRLHVLWSEQKDIAADAQLTRLIARMTKPDAPDPRAGSARAGPNGGLPTWRKAVRLIDLANRVGWGSGPADQDVPRRAVYINVGQLGLAVPQFHRWLARRPDLTAAIMLHDVIPLEYPHLVSPGSTRRHGRMVATTARHADCLIFNTEYARRGVAEALRPFGRHGVPSLVRPLPLPHAFATVESGLPELSSHRYFIVVATIEPRKNHELLLRVWARMMAREGDAAPHLVIVGVPGAKANDILAPLERDPAMRRRVHHTAGLSSPALAALVAGATALLSPTYVEGFGLPILEALALGVPVIASDIAAHREVSDGTTVLLAADDDHGWERAIAALPAAPRPPVTPPPRALTEAAYCEDIVAFARSVAARRFA